MLKVQKSNCKKMMAVLHDVVEVKKRHPIGCRLDGDRHKGHSETPSFQKRKKESNKFA